MNESTDNVQASPTPHEDRYKRVGVDGHSEMEHRVIMEQILGHEIPEGYVVHHKDKNVLNNDPSNLQLLTREEHDELHRQEHINQKNKAKAVCCKDEQGNVIKVYESMAATAQDGYNPESVRNCANGCQKSHGGVYWEYVGKPRENRRYIPVISVDPYTREEHRYESAADACRECGLNSMRLGAILRGKAAVWRLKGLIWLREEDKAKKLEGMIKACLAYDASRRRAVRCYNTHTGDLVAEYPDALTAVAELRAVTATRLHACCRGEVASCGGYIWRFASDNLDHVEPILKYVAAIDPTTDKIVAVYRTLAATEVIDGFNQRTVGLCCRGQYVKTTGGFKWKFIEPSELPTDLPPEKMHLGFTYTSSHVV